jgi:ATP-binding cassette, subfamily B, bacterial
MELLRGVGAIFAGGWRTSRARMLAAFALLLLNYAAWPLGPLALKHVTDAVVAGDVRGATIAAAVLPLAALFGYVGGHLAHVMLVELADLYVLRVRGELGELTQGGAGLEHLERADYADRLELMRNEGNPLYQSVHAAVRGVSLVVQFGITVVLLATLQPLLLLLLLAAAPPLIATRWSFNHLDRVNLENADLMRRSTHLLDLATRQDAAKEIRVFGLQDELRRRLRESRRELRRRQFRAQATGVFTMAGGQLVFAVAYVGGLLLVVRGAIDGEQSVGDVVLAVTLAAQTNELVFETVAGSHFLQRAAGAMARLAWLRDLVGRLWASGERDARVPDGLRDGIRFEDVGFRYPGTDAEVLREIDLDLAAGTTVALVGENGAGKTTLVKLLCGFYEPTDGRIAVDGVDLSRMPLEEWRERIAAGFQDFVRFELVARESVGVGDLPALDDLEAVRDAVERADARDLLERLPEGLETQLGKSYAAGAELSGGQWQKVALARAMMRTRPLLLVLDEPTSALDAHAEHVLFERYAASARAVAKATGGVAVFVSHRFSTVRMADRIVVVDDGRIAEQGTHGELVALGGVYAELFALQAAAYG